MKDKLIKTYGEIGINYRNLSDYQKSLDYHLKSLQLSEILKDKSKIASSLNNIGRVYVDIGDIEKALAYHQKSLKLANELSYSDLVPSVLINLGVDYCRLQKQSIRIYSLLKITPICYPF